MKMELPVPTFIQVFMMQNISKPLAKTHISIPEETIGIILEALEDYKRWWADPDGETDEDLPTASIDEALKIIRDAPRFSCLESGSTQNRTHVNRVSINKSKKQLSDQSPLPNAFLLQETSHLRGDRTIESYLISNSTNSDTVYVYNDQGIYFSVLTSLQELFDFILGGNIENLRNVCFKSELELEQWLKYKYNVGKHS